MSEQISGKEPNPFAPAVRGFFDGRRVPYNNLAEIRAAMTNDDHTLIDVISTRRIDDYFSQPVSKVEDSARSVVADLTRQRHPKQKGLPELVSLVFGVIAPQHSPVSELDIVIIDTIAARVRKSIYATAFKLDREEGLAPGQQAKNQAKAIEIAMGEDYLINPLDADLPELIGRVYEVLIPGTVALQQAEFANTYRFDDWDGIGFRGIDLAA